MSSEITGRGPSQFTPLAERVAACSHTEHRTVRMVFSGRYEPDAEWEPCPPVKGRTPSSKSKKWEGIVEVCKTCDRKAVWPFCEHKTNDGSWYRLAMVREVGR